ncbi:hypothetical protein HanIR_Chr13g0637131 [Helianthus annuus]|nr:hypothetical protein HanIR_Chr13g0637131 [Helianthus annuus]
MVVEVRVWLVCGGVVSDEGEFVVTRRHWKDVRVTVRVRIGSEIRNRGLNDV